MKWHLVWKNVISCPNIKGNPRQSCVLDFCQRELGFRIPIFSGIPDSLISCLSAKVKDCGCHKQIPGFQNLDQFPYGPYTGQHKLCVSYILRPCVRSLFHTFTCSLIYSVHAVILLHEKFLQFDWLRAAAA